MGTRLLDWLRRHTCLLVCISIITYTAVFIGFSAYKLDTFGYNALDLGIYTNVAWHTVHGDPFGMTIHPQSYLGDHFEPAFLLVAGAYGIFSSPLTLLILQTLVIALTAWPIYLLARKRLGNLTGAIVALLFLMNPFVQNANAFEFHMLVFAILPLAWAAIAYEQRQWWRFATLLVLAMTVREDVSLLVLAWGIFAWVDGRPWRWRLAPLIGGTLWFAIALMLITKYNPDGTYKFLAYYPTTDGSVALFTQIPALLGAVLSRIISFETIILCIALLIPFMGLPLLGIRKMIPTMLIILQLVLTGFTELVLKTHYGILLLPALFTASIAGLERLRQSPPQVLRQITNIHRLILGLFIMATLYGTVTFGPLPAFVTSLAVDNPSSMIVREAVGSITPTDRVVASFAPLTSVAGREHIYSLHYAFLGARQYSDAPYTIPDDADTLLIDFRDLLVYELQAGNITPYVRAREDGPRRIRELINNRGFRLERITGTVAVYRNNGDHLQDDIQLVSFPTTLPDNLRGSPRDLGPVTFLGWATGIDGRTDLYWKANGTLEDRYQLSIGWTSTDGTFHTDLYPLAYGLHPTTEWIPGQIVQTSYWFPAEIRAPGGPLEVMVTSIQGFMSLDGMRTASMEITADVPLAREWIQIE